MQVRWAAAFAATMWASPVLACGGLFCDGGATTPQPVEQSAERILFVVNEGRVCSHISIQYAGAPENFAWIIPVPAVAEVSESDAQLFFDLAAETAMPILGPSLDYSACEGAFDADGYDDDESSGCACPIMHDVEESADGGAAGGGGDGEVQVPPPVEVLGQTFTERYEAVVLQGESSEALLGWLNDNQFNVSEGMRPAIDPYVEEGMKFVAVKLRADVAAREIVPLRLCYDAAGPSIPLRMTGVAARPQTNVVTYILADVPYAPSNFDAVRPDSEALHVDTTTPQTSYLAWVSRTVAEAEGRRFVLEFAGEPLTPLDAYDATIGSRHTILTRYFTRLDPEHMTRDPVFVASQAVPDRGPEILDFSALTVDGCGLEAQPEPSACAFEYCGRGARCVTDDVRAGCVCREWQVAQVATALDGTAHPTCVPVRNRLGVPDEAVGAGTDLDPCAQYFCGAGECTLRGGFPACACDAGAMAVADAGGLIRCVRPEGRLVEVGEGAGPEAARPKAKMQMANRRFGPSEGPSLAFSFGFVVMAGWRVLGRRRG